MDQFYFSAKKSNLSFYQAVPLYFQNKKRKFILYKPAGTVLNNIRIEQGQLPEKLFIKRSDELKSIREVQNAFNQELKKDIKSNNPVKIKETIINIVEETFSMPISGSIEGLSTTVNILVSEYTKESNLIKKLLFVPHDKYSPVLHSVNVMALAVGFSFHEQFSLAERKILGLSALVHDVGKTKINTNILNAPNRLDDEEFKELQTHATIGYQIIGKCKFANPDIKITALQHHERIDGSGYPNELRRISRIAQIVGIIDCYEALTNDERPYRSAMDSLKALTVLKDDTEAGKFSKKIFEKFAYSLM